MEEKFQLQRAGHCVPIWLKLIWGIFAIWALLYVTIYILPDFGQWISSTDPDTAQWQLLNQDIPD